MFDLTSMKLLILGLVALIVVGPKDLPILLRTVGKYVAMIRRQAAEFRSQFDEAMRDQELQTLREEMEAMKRDVKATVDSAGRAVETDLSATTREIDNQIKSPTAVPGTAVPGTAVPGTAVSGTAMSGAAVRGTAVPEIEPLDTPRFGHGTRNLTAEAHGSDAPTHVPAAQPAPKVEA